LFRKLGNGFFKHVFWPEWEWLLFQQRIFFVAWREVFIFTSMKKNSGVEGLITGGARTNSIPVPFGVVMLMPSSASKSGSTRFSILAAARA